MNTICISRKKTVTESEEYSLPAYFYELSFNTHKYIAMLPNDLSIMVRILPLHSGGHVATVSLYDHNTLMSDVEAASLSSDAVFYEAYAKAQHLINAAAGVTYHGINVLVDDGEDYETEYDEEFAGDSDEGWRSRDYITYLDQEDARREAV